MSTPSLASPVSRTFIVRPLDGTNQVYENIPANATVKNLKERIFIAEAIPIENQKLICGAEVLDDFRTLESYHISEGFVIRLLTVVHPPATSTIGTGNDQRVFETIFVRSANGQTVTMNQVKARTTVAEFREQYSRKQGQDPEFCRLILYNKELEDIKGGRVMTLMDYNVQNDTTLHEVFRVPGGHGS